MGGLRKVQDREMHAEELAHALPFGTRSVRLDSLVTDKEQVNLRVVVCSHYSQNAGEYRRAFEHVPQGLGRLCGPR